MKFDDFILEVHFQPIISFHQSTIVGYEAFLRGIYQTEEITKYLSAEDLFNYAKESGRSLQLNVAAVKLAISKFESFYQFNKNIYLFVKITNYIVEHFQERINLISAFASQANIPNSTIILEIDDEESVSDEYLQRFCTKHKELGFSIAIDNYSIEHSNYRRLLIVKPYIIKICRTLIHNVSDDFYSREVLNLISRWADKTGSLLVAQGIEDESQISMLMEFHIELFQGYFFNPPQKSISKNSDMMVQLNMMRSLYQSERVKKLRDQKRYLTKIKLAMKYFIEETKLETWRLQKNRNLFTQT
jgi:EAL domain-containing protein (putative c-di-GMP-specific phosphodiesterase class I)